MHRVELTFWWWGEDEAPGLGRWVDSVCAGFERRTGTVVRTRLLRHDEVIPGFPGAAAADAAPDLHFFWNGIYLVENVWRGYLAPLDELLEPEEIRAFGGGPQSTVDGACYRVGWYAIPVVWVANRALLDEVPRTWAGCEDAAARLRERGRSLLAAGDGEGDLSVWWLTHFLTQQVDEAADAPRLALGELDWSDARYRRPWELLAHARANGWFDDATLALTLWHGLHRFTAGEAALTLASGPMFAACRDRLGDAATVLTAPRAGDGPLAGLPIVDTQGIGISSTSRRKELAAELLRYMHEPEQLRSLWEQTRQFPADRRWDAQGVEDPDYRRLWEWFAQGPNAPYLPNLLPLDLHFRVGVDVGRAVLAGTLDPTAAGLEASAQARAWREGTDTRAYAAWAFAAAAAA